MLVLGVKSLCANFEGSDLQGCNFEDPGGRPANLEGVNLKGANLEGSNLTGINLRVATLKNANLKNCDLRAAVLAGADLEVSIRFWKLIILNNFCFAFSVVICLGVIYKKLIYVVLI